MGATINIKSTTIEQTAAEAKGELKLILLTKSSPEFCCQDTNYCLAHMEAS